MIIGVDLDGVLRDIHTALCIAWFLKTGIYVIPSDFTEWGIHRFMNPEKVDWTKDDFYNWWFNNEAIYEVSRVIHSSQAAMQTLAKGHRLILVTSQPTAIARRKSLEFIEKHFPDTFEAVFFGRDKNLVKLDALIDDSVANLESTSATHKICFSQPWNADAKDFIRADDWEGVLEYFKRRIP